MIFIGGLMVKLKIQYSGYLMPRTKSREFQENIYLCVPDAGEN